jgi:small subunit ribosomal protein S9
MADEPQTPEEEPQVPAEAQAPEEPQASAEAQAPESPERSEQESEALAEHHAVPTTTAAEIAGSAEDAALEAFEEARDAPAGDAPAEPVIAEEPPAEPPASEESSATPEEPAGGEPVAAEESPVAAESPAGQSPAAAEEELDEEDEEEPAPRVKPAVPGAHLEVDIVPEGVDPLGRDIVEDPYAIDEDASQGQTEAEDEDQALPEPISTAAIDLAAGARYRATGKRKTAIARVILRPGSGTYKINGRPLDAYFPRPTLQRNIRQPLETVGYEERMDVVARLHGGGVSAQAGALRHGISRALLEADPNLRGELKRRGFLTRDSRAKERKKAGLKKARKRPQFSKR